MSEVLQGNILGQSGLADRKVWDLSIYSSTFKVFVLTSINCDKQHNICLLVSIIFLLMLFILLSLTKTFLLMEIKLKADIDLFMNLFFSRSL